MTERVPSDHDAVPSHRTHVASVGPTRRPRVPLPAVVEGAPGEVVRVSLEGDPSHARVHESLEGDRDLRGAFANARLARTDGEGENRLRAWLDAVGVSPEEPIFVDILTPGFEYGLRRPGERVVYEAADPPQSSLADIARNLDG